MFRANVLIIMRSKLHYTASDIITPIGGRLVLFNAILTFWWWAHLLETCRRMKIRLIVKQILYIKFVKYRDKFVASSAIITQCCGGFVTNRIILYGFLKLLTRSTKSLGCIISSFLRKMSSFHFHKEIFVTFTTLHENTGRWMHIMFKNLWVFFKNISNSSHEIYTTLCLRNVLFWDTTARHWMIISLHFEISSLKVRGSHEK
jgi:hypothetical protein